MIRVPNGFIDPPGGTAIEGDSSFWRKPVAAHVISDRCIDRVAVGVDRLPERSFQADPFDDVELAGSLPEEDARRLPWPGQQPGSCDLEIVVQHIRSFEMDALHDVEVTVVGQTDGSAAARRV